jgi:hypothetical protein
MALIEVIPEFNCHEGWTARQVVHHLADEHINEFTYFKTRLTSRGCGSVSGSDFQRR